MQVQSDMSKTQCCVKKHEVNALLQILSGGVIEWQWNQQLLIISPYVNYLKKQTDNLSFLVSGRHSQSTLNEKALL